MSMTYLGLALGAVAVGGAHGPETHEAPAGGGLAVFSVSPFTEGDHSRLAALAQGTLPPPAPVPTSGTGTTGQTIGGIIDEVEAALRNDGNIDQSERAAILQHTLQHLGAPASVSALAGGHLDLGQAVADVLSLVRGR